MNLWKLALIAATVAALGCGGCDDESGNNTNLANGDGDVGSSADIGASADAAGLDGADMSASADTGGSADMGSRQDYCDGNGPPILQPGTADETCTGQIAEVSFRFALCSCEGFVTSGSITTSAIDSADMMSGQSASIGTNGKFDAAAGASIGGSLWASGDGGMTLNGAVDVTGDLKAGGNVSSGGDLSVGNDADIDGDLVAQGNVTVSGTLTQSPGTNRTVAGNLSTQSTRDAAVNVQTPCDCADDLILPVGAIVTSMASNNDNADTGFDPDALQNIASDTAVDVPCGRFYLSGVNGAGAVTFNVSGRAALFIDGDVSLSQDFTINLEPDAELDLFVAGNVTLAGIVVIGDPDRPAATRIYVGGTGTVAIAAEVELNANLYAPKAEVVLAANTEIRGSVFARRVALSGAVSIVYDEAILDAGADCDGSGGGSGDPNDPDNPATCDSCRDCRNQACVNGECGQGCTTNADCCAPLICRSGECTVIE